MAGKKGKKGSKKVAGAPSKPKPVNAPTTFVDLNEGLGERPTPKTPDVAISAVPQPETRKDKEGEPKVYKPACCYDMAFTDKDREVFEKHPEYLKPFEIMRMAEYKWRAERERAPETCKDWVKYVLLAGPMPGPAPDPNEEWPGKEREREKYRRRLRIMRGGDKLPVSQEAQKRTYQPVEESKASKDFRKAALEAAKGGKSGIPKDKAIALCRFLGYVPDEDDVAKLPDELSDQDFDTFILAAQHPEDGHGSLLEVFRGIDFGGKMSFWALERLLSDFGQKLDPAASKEAVNTFAAKKDGGVDTQAFVENLLAANRKLPDREAFSNAGINPSSLPERSENVVTHFAPIPEGFSDLEDYDLPTERTVPSDRTLRPEESDVSELSARAMVFSPGRHRKVTLTEEELSEMSDAIDDVYASTGPWLRG